MAGLNKNNSAVKRIMQEARELAKDPSTDYTANPLEDDIFEWHCTLRAPSGTEFEGGLYHFRILLPAEYPFKAPSIICLTPNGRFELNTKICISFTSYHEDMWQPAWGVRTAIVGLQGFFPLRGTAAVGVGSIEAPPNERKRLATLSRNWKCPHCQVSNLELLPNPDTNCTSSESTLFPAQGSRVGGTDIPSDSNEAINSPPQSSDDQPPVPQDSQIPEKSSETPAHINTPLNIIQPQPTKARRRHIALVDGAIVLLLGLLCALLCRRMI